MLTTGILSLIIFGYVLYFIIEKKYAEAVFFTLLGIIYMVFFPRWERNKYPKQFKKHVNKSLSSEFGTEVNLTVHQNLLEFSKGDNQSTLPADQIAQFVEIPEYLFVFVEKGVAFMLPKKRITENGWLQLFHDFAAENKITYVYQNDWVWK